MNCVSCKYIHPEQTSFSNLSDVEIREVSREFHNSSNGDYLYSICTGCGSTKMSPETLTKDAEIVSTCKECDKHEGGTYNV